MPKTTRETQHSFNARMVRQYPNILEVDCSQLYCKLCQRNLNGTKSFTIQQHFRTMKHQAALQYAVDVKGENKFENVHENKSEKVESVQYEEKVDETTLPICGYFNDDQMLFSNFSLDLCTTFLEANIPLETINNPSVQTFLQKYTQNPIPNELTLRSKYVPTLYDRYIHKLQNIAEDKQIWVSINETLDNKQNLVVNFVFGLLEENEKGKSFMLNLLHLDKATPSALAAFFNNSLQILWPEEIKYENVRLVVTDSVPYMRTALKSLKILFPNMIYINCLSQSYQKFSEYIRVYFTEVDEFLAHCRRVFLKSPYRQHLLSRKLSKFPPALELSKTAIWLKTAIYCSDHFNEITNLLQLLNKEDYAECAQQSLHLTNNSKLKEDLLYIKHNFECLVLSTIKLETIGLPLNEGLATITEIKASLESTKRQDWMDKFEEILKENCDLLEFKEKALEFNFNVKQESHKEEEVPWTYKYAPVVLTSTKHLSYTKSLLENGKNL